MAKEILDGGDSRKLSGRCSFSVIGVPEKIVMSGGKVARNWMLRSLDNPDMKPIKYRVASWQSKEICLITGGTLMEDGKWEWDDETVDGKCFSAEVTYEDNFSGKINPRTNKPYTNMVLSNFEEIAPF